MIAYAINVLLEFPVGLSAICEKNSNTYEIARNGMGNPVLRGNSLAGVLRKEWRKYKGSEDETIKFFGQADDVNTSEQEASNESPVFMPCVILDLGRAPVESITYHRRNRHTGTVLSGSLFSIEQCPPKTKASFVLWIESDELCESDVKEFIYWLDVIFTLGVSFGGNINRGVGIAFKLNDTPLQYFKYDLSNQDSLVKYFVAKQRSSSGKILNDINEVLLVDNNDCYGDIKKAVCDNIFVCELVLKIPQGQDILVGDGNPLDMSEEPQRTTDIDGEEYWRLPGSTLRGSFRDWITRIALRDSENPGIKVADSYSYFKTDDYSLENVSWLLNKEPADDEDFIDSIPKSFPVDDLFGSLHKAGRLQIYDSLSKIVECDGETTYELCKKDNSQVQKRSHVKIDSITGGNVTHSLFDNAVLISGENSPEWNVIVRIDNPRQCDIKWLKKAINALNIGLLRIGSSKSSGRLIVSNIEGILELFSTWNAKFKENNNA